MIRASEFSEARVFFMTVRVSGPVAADSGMIVNLIDIRTLEAELIRDPFLVDGSLSLSTIFEKVLSFCNSKVLNLGPDYACEISFENFKRNKKIQYLGSQVWLASIQLETESPDSSIQQTAVGEIVTSQIVKLFADSFDQTTSVLSKIMTLKKLERLDVATGVTAISLL